MLVSALALPQTGNQPDPVRQVVVVTSERWHSQRATLRRYQLAGDTWVRAGRPTRAWVGVNGFAPHRTRRQNSGQTPAGVFTMPLAFGAASQPRVELPYHRITPHSYWPYDPRDPRTYNVLQTQRSTSARWRDDGSWSERLADYGRQYRLAVVIGYNLPAATYRDRASGEWRARQPARTDKGGGIFLHVDRGRPTAGCVAIGLRQMRHVMKWLDPDLNPRVVMGPRTVTRDWRDRIGET